MTKFFFWRCRGSSTVGGASATDDFCFDFSLGGETRELFLLLLSDRFDGSCCDLVVDKNLSLLELWPEFLSEILSPEFFESVFAAEIDGDRRLTRCRCWADISRATSGSGSKTIRRNSSSFIITTGRHHFRVFRVFVSSRTDNTSD